MAQQRKDDVSSVKTIVDWFDSSVASCNDTMLRSIERMEPPTTKRRILPHSHLISAFEGISMMWKVTLTVAMCVLVVMSLGGRGETNRSRVMGAGELIGSRDEVFVPDAYKELVKNSEEAMACAQEEVVEVVDDEFGRLLSSLDMHQYHDAFQKRSMTLQTLGRVWPNAAKWRSVLSLVIADEARSSLLRFAVFLISFGPNPVAVENVSNRLQFLARHGIDSLPSCASASEEVMKGLVDAMQALGLAEQGEYARILAECTE